MLEPTPHLQSLAMVLIAAGAVAQAPLVRLEGTVIDAVAAAAVNAAITVEVDGQTVARTRSDATGYFMCAKVPAQRAIVRAVGAADAGAVVVDLTAGIRDWVRIAVYPTRTVRGRVVAADGTAVAAWVVATPIDDPEIAVVDAMVQAGRDGAFELPHVLVGPVRVRAWAAGHGIFETTIDGETDREVAGELGEASDREVTFALRGATPEQLAATTLRVFATRTGPMRLPPPLCLLTPDAEGNCVVRGWSTDDSLVGEFRVPGLAVVPPADFAPRGPRHWKCAFDVQTAMLTGVLRDDAGQPLGGQWLYGRTHGSGDVTGGSMLAQTAPDGAFRLPAPVALGERFSLALVGSDHALVQAEGRKRGLLSRHVARHEEGVAHDLVARRCGPVRLRVLDGDDKPVAGAMVVLQQLFADGGPDTWGPDAGAFTHRAGTGADGRVEFPGIELRERGWLAFDVVAATGVAAARCETGSGKAVDLAITLQPAPPFGGIVRDAEGRPVSGARVQLVIHEPVIRMQTVLTGRDGRFLVADLRPGPIGWVAHRGGGSSSIQRKLDLPATGITDLELTVK